MLALPERATDRIALADWLELLALVARRKQSSPADLERALQRSGVYKHRESIEPTLAAVLTELEARVRSAGKAYPFELQGGVLRLRADSWRMRSTYLFCLCLTTQGNRPDGAGTYPERIFETLCTRVARNFLAGEGIRFGSPRHPGEIEPAFGKAVEAVCVRLGEGGGYSKRQTHWSKDGGVDVIAWRSLRDKLPGQLVLFGGCASGKDWDEKLGQCNPLAWSNAWMKQAPASPILNAFFLPHRIDTGEAWTILSWQVGLIFDRCRIAHLAATLPPTTRHGSGTKWARASFRRLTARRS